jgi:hypothetical protein
MLKLHSWPPLPRRFGEDCPCEVEVNVSTVQWLIVLRIVDPVNLSRLDFVRVGQRKAFDPGRSQNT